MAEDDKDEDRHGGFEPPEGAPPPAWKPTPPPTWSPTPPPTFRPPDIQPPQPPPGAAPPGPPPGSPPSSSPPAGQEPPPPPPSPAPYSPPPGAPPPTYGAPPPPPNPYGPQFPQQGPYYPGYPPQPYVVRKTNGFAIASLILGVIWMYWVGSILALIFGYIGKNQIDNSNNTQDGRGLAIAGIVLGWIGVAALIIFIIAVAASGS